MIWMVRSKGDLLCWESKFFVLFGWQSGCWGFWGWVREMKKGCVGGKLFHHSFYSFNEKETFLFGYFFKQSGKEHLPILLAIKMKIGFRKLILLFPSVQHLYGNPTCRVWTSSFKIKLHFWNHQGLLCCVPSPIPYEQNQWEAKQYLKNQTFKAFYGSDTPNIRTYTGKHAHCVHSE